MVKLSPKMKGAMKRKSGSVAFAPLGVRQERQAREGVLSTVP